MTTNATKEAIERVIDNFNNKTHTDMEPPRDIASLEKYLLNKELMKEISQLLTMIESSDNIETLIKARCIKRQSLPHHNLTSNTTHSSANALYWAISGHIFQPNTLIELLNILSPDRGTDDFLYRVANDPTALQFFLDFHHKTQHFDVINNQNNDGIPLLHKAVNNAASFKILLNLFSAETCYELTTAPDAYGRTLLQKAANSPASLKILLDLFSPEQCYDLATAFDENGRTFLHWTASNPESLAVILDKIPGKRLDAIMIQDDEGSTALIDAAPNPKSLVTILARLPKPQRFEALTLEMSAGYGGITAMHEAISNPASLRIILTLLPEAQRYKALNIQDDLGNTPLYDARDNSPRAFEVINEFFPPLSTLVGYIDTLQKKNDNPRNRFRAGFNENKILLEKLRDLKGYAEEKLSQGERCHTINRTLFDTIELLEGKLDINEYKARAAHQINTSSHDIKTLGALMLAITIAAFVAPVLFPQAAAIAAVAGASCAISLGIGFFANTKPEGLSRHINDIAKVKEDDTPHWNSAQFSY